MTYRSIVEACENGRGEMSPNARLMSVVNSFATMCIGAVLVKSAILHLQNSYAFLASVYSYDLMSPNLGVLVAALLPSIQLALGVMLLFFGDRRVVGLICCALMFLSFSVIQMITLWRGLNISCGCFGASIENPVGPASIIYAGALGVLSAGVAMSLRAKRNAKV